MGHLKFADFSSGKRKSQSDAVPVSIAIYLLLYFPPVCLIIYLPNKKWQLLNFSNKSNGLRGRVLLTFMTWNTYPRIIFDHK